MCISPLTAIMMDQCSEFTLRGLKTGFVGEAQTNPEVEALVVKGNIQLVYISPENMINDTRYRRMILSPVYQSNLVALIVDEAHCVKTWGDVFWIAFVEIGSLRSHLSDQLRIMALTATATHDCMKIITERLAMENQIYSYLTKYYVQIRAASEPNSIEWESN